MDLGGQGSVIAARMAIDDAGGKVLAHALGRDPVELRLALLNGKGTSRGIPIFTRFIPPERPDQMPGMWQRYYTRWRAATRECLDLDLLELMQPLAALCPPAMVIDKTRYSGFAEPKLLAHLREREADALIISGI